MRLATWVLFLNLGLAACSNAMPRTVVKTPEEEQVAQAIESIMNNDACSADTPEQCQFVDVVFDPKAPEAGDENIMIMDVAMVVPTLSLHKSRVLNHFKITNGPDYYVPFKPTMKMPQGMRAILHQTLRGKENLAASIGLKELGLKFLKKYGKLVEGNKMGHGTTSFNILAELNPKAKFVVVHDDEEFAPTPICKLTEENGREELETYWSRKAEALVKIARDYKVKYVNLSAGYSVREAQELWRDKNCQGEYPSTQDLRWFVEKSNAIPKALTKIPGLLYAQSAPYSNSYLGETTKRDFAGDCELIPGRLRIGYLNLVEPTIPFGKERDTRLLSNIQRNVAPCADVFIRDGKPDVFEYGELAIQYSGFGFGHGGMNASGTSYIAPVGLGYGAYLMKTKGLSPSDAVKDIRGIYDSPLLVAPFKNREFLNTDPRYLNWYENQ